MSIVTLILPKDKTSLRKKYAEKLAEIVSRKLTADELQYLITELEKKDVDDK
ncbi:hypothetical protein [Clostridium magnum]|uniref:Uncharacterized protein n=1 Tax=Clostridium magnum DSM 2767 TaxID=1121326 RepID=A0A161YRE4_9CLOT|nr:hypothetical protein [Clostridium magnum]KZL93522.1 hypothetical protein CLMAG_05680 [Clostridium magnum DSM 2767]SHI27209.1 hypothetical protein SAMN02745944_03829 [Clostridium magnum DSM 2767]